MQGEPAAAAETCVTLQEPEVCHVFPWGSCPWIMTLAVARCTGSLEGRCG